MCIYIYIYRFNPVESNYKDGPTGHENISIVNKTQIPRSYPTCFDQVQIFHFSLIKLKMLKAPPW